MTEDVRSGSWKTDLRKTIREDRIGFDPETETYYAQ